MPSTAHITLVGHLGRDPETKTTASGTTMLTFSLATSRKRSGAETTTWWRVTVFGRRVESLTPLMQDGLLAKGALVYVAGDVEQRAYTTQHGEERTSLDVTADTVEFLSAPRDQSRPPRPTADDIAMDEVPF